jgi:hypothetical protein
LCCQQITTSQLLNRGEKQLCERIRKFTKHLSGMFLGTVSFINSLSYPCTTVSTQASSAYFICTSCGSPSLLACAYFSTQFSSMTARSLDAVWSSA